MNDHRYKEEVVASYKSEYNILIETGTYNGEMVEAQRSNFKMVYSIELSNHLYINAYKRFADFKNVIILQGDSAEWLTTLVSVLTEPALFWLDAHYSGGNTAMGDSPCPLLGELDSIINSPFAHGILIDDARCFGTTKGFPGLSDISDIIGDFTITNDIIWKSL